MATAAQRDKQIEAATKRGNVASVKADKARADLAEHTKVVDTQQARIEWLRGMPVDDEPQDEGDDDAISVPTPGAI